jgi:hypothetical protein
MEKFKMRAECLADWENVVSEYPKSFENVEILQDKDFPDVEIVFKSKRNINQLIALLEILEDTHVMIDTLAFIDEYTGERTYSA